MNIDKEQILQLLRSQGDDAKAQQAEQELPGQVDTDRDAACCPSSASIRWTWSRSWAAAGGSEVCSADS